MIKLGLLQEKGDVLDLSKYIYHLGRSVSWLHFYSKVVLHGCGTLPLWILISQKTPLSLGAIGVAIISVLFSFGIPLVIIEHYVFRNIVWENYWKQIVSFPLSKRNRLITISCAILILFVALYCAIYLLCIPNLRLLSQ